MISDKTCLVTGASGFIGQHLVKTLRKAGYRVLATGRSTTPPQSVNGLIWKWIPCDLSIADDIKHLADEVRGVLCFFHLAATVLDSHNLSEIEGHYRSDVIAPVQLADLLSDALRQIVMFSSVAVYGSQGKEIDETADIRPEGIYGANKIVVEDGLDFISRLKSIRLAIMRISSVYGTGMPAKNAIPQFISCLRNSERPKISASPKARRDYIYVGDVCASALSAAEKEVHGIYNIASASPQTLPDVAMTIANLLGKDLKPDVVDHSPGIDRLFKVDKALSELDFRPTELSKGLEQVIGDV